MITGTRLDTINLLRLLLTSISSIGNFSGVSKENIVNHLIHFNILDTKLLVSSMLLSNIIRYKRIIFDEVFEKKYKKSIVFLTDVIRYLAENDLYILLDKQKLNKFIKEFKAFYDDNNLEDNFNVSFTVYGNRVTHININDMCYEFHDNVKRSHKAFRYNSLLLDWQTLMKHLDAMCDDNLPLVLDDIFDINGEEDGGFVNSDNNSLMVFNEKSIEKINSLDCFIYNDIIALSNTKSYTFNILIAKLLIYSKWKEEPDG